jgi:aminodeoxyfutalosine deaminase
LGIGISIVEFCKMGFRKFRSDRLFDGYQMLSGMDVLVMKEDGKVEGIFNNEEAGDNIEYYPGIISPGFINCHCHLELSHMKNLIPPKTGLTDFVSRIIADRHFSEEIILNEIAKAEDEMLKAGIVAVGDICNNTLTIPQKIKGRMWYHNFIEASGFPPQVADQRFHRSVNIFNEYSKHYTMLSESNSIVPHAPYSVSDELWEKIIHFPDNHLMTIHNQETEGENEFFEKGSGEFTELYKKMNIDISFFQPKRISSLQSYLQKFLSTQPIIAVHNVHTNKEDIYYARNSGKIIYWCFCPNANLYITGKLPVIDTFIEEECCIVLGTDSLASNQQLSILAEMQTIRHNFPSVTNKLLFQWATINGAKALQMDGLLGSFEPGKKPGVILVDPELVNVRRLM